MKGKIFSKISVSNLIFKDIYCRDYLISHFNISPNKIIVASFWYPPTIPQNQILKNRNHFMMLGNFLHPPNVDALNWVSKSLWNKIKEKIPDAQLHVYGAYPTKNAKEYEKKSIDLYVHGPIDDLSPLFQKFRINFAPLRFGAGIKGKITDGWYYGVPCITTRIGAEGLLNSNEYESFGGIIANSEDDIVNAAVSLYNNDQYWLELAEKGDNIIKKYFAFETSGEIFKNELLQKIGQKDMLRKNNIFGSILSYNQHRATEYFSRFIGKKNLFNR